MNTNRHMAYLGVITMVWDEMVVVVAKIYMHTNTH